MSTSEKSVKQAGEFSGGVRLRDRRLPRHCWQDNEIWDVFGDELGALGISLYATMSRLCFGVRLKAGVREIAEHARMSKSSCARTLEVLIGSGLVIRHLGRTTLTACTYELVDVKELVAARVKNTAECPTEGQLQRGAAGTYSIDSGTDVSLCGTTLISKTQDKYQDTTPQPPALRAGGVAEAVLDEAGKRSAEEYIREVEAAAVANGPNVGILSMDERFAPVTVVAPPSPTSETAMLERWAREALRRMHVADPRDRLLATVVAAFRIAWGDEPGGMDLASCAMKAAESWAELERLNGRGLLLRGMPKAGEFFRAGMWREENRWPMDMNAVRGAQRANVGRF